MTTLELKKLLISKISEIEDEKLLISIKTFLEAKSPSGVLTIPDDVKAEIVESRKQIAKGMYIDQEDLDKKAEEWLKGE